jgi:Tol biopolymer transport system component
MRRALPRVIAAGITVAVVWVGVALCVPSTAPALVPLPEYVSFVHQGVLERVLAGDDAPIVLVDPAELPADDAGFGAPLEVVAHWWAPDGKHVLVGVRSLSNGTQKLFICSDGGGERVAVSAAGGLFVPSGDVYRSQWGDPVPVWAPDGQSFALTVMEGGAPFGDIYVVGLDGTGRIVGSGIEPAWSPDATQIAYVRAVPETTSLDEARPYVTVGTLDGGSIDLGIGREPVFSPDGSQVLYRTWTDSGGEGGDSEQLAIAPADGGSEQPLTSYGPMDDMGGPSAIFGHRFSPDGTKVYYLLGRRSDSRYVYEVAADGSYAAPVPVSGLASEFTLDNDGTRLVYTNGQVYEASYQTNQQVIVRDLASCAEWQLSPGELVDFTCSTLSVSHENRHVAFQAAVIPEGSVPASVDAHEVWTATLDGTHAWRCATDSWDAASVPRYGASTSGSGTGDSGTTGGETRAAGFFQAIAEAIGSFFRWLAGLFS